MDREEVLARLRRNDPSETDVRIELSDFYDDRIVPSLAEALHANDHVTSLDLGITGLPRMTNTNWDSLLRVIAERENLEKVNMDDCPGVGHRNPPDRIIPFLLAIQQNPSVQSMSFYYVQLAGDSMASFLDNATSVAELILYGCGLETPADAFAMAAALERNTNIQRLELLSLDEMILIPLLNSLASEQSKLQALSLTMCIVHQRERETFHAAILSLLQPHSLLRSLELNDFNNLSTYGFETAEEFDLLFTAVEKSPLEGFSIARINSRESCLALIASIPKMQVGTLEFSVHHDLQYMKTHLIGAIKRNASLRTVVFKRDFLEDWLDYNERMKLISYSIRNEFLLLWSATPAMLPYAAWPEALAVAQTTGPNAVFRILQLLAPALWASEE